MLNTALLIKNPLAATHEFKQACQLCYPKTGNSTCAASALCSGDARNLRSVEATLLCVSGRFLKEDKALLCRK